VQPQNNTKIISNTVSGRTALETSKLHENRQYDDRNYLRKDASLTRGLEGRHALTSKGYSYEQENQTFSTKLTGVPLRGAAPVTDKENNEGPRGMSGPYLLK